MADTLLVEQSCGRFYRERRHPTFSFKNNWRRIVGFSIFAAPFEGEVQVTLGLPNGFFQMAFCFGYTFSSF